MKKIVALIIFVLSLAIYLFFCQKTYQDLNYFVPLANAFVHGRIDVEKVSYLNELVEHAGKWYVVYPPAPAVVLLPAVMIWGLGFNQVWASVLLAAGAVALFYLLAREVAKKETVALAITALFGFGTNFFFTALVGSSWYFAHICAVFFMVLGLLLAIRKHPLLAGISFAMMFLSRLPTFLALPVFLYFVISKNPKDKIKATFKFLLPIVAAIAVFAFYNWARFGTLTQTGYSLIPGVLQEPWFQKGIFSFSYIPRQLQAIFWSFPQISAHFPFFLPYRYAMALWLTTPALLLLIFVKLKNRIVFWFLLSALLVAIPSLVHGTVGFTQFGYRFSLDFIVLLLVPLIFVFEKMSWRIWTIFVVLSIAINLWVAILFALGIFSY